MSDARPYTPEDIARLRAAKELGPLVHRWLATLARVEASRDAEIATLREALGRLHAEAKRALGDDGGEAMTGASLEDEVVRVTALLSAPSPENALERIGLQIAGLVWALAAPDKELDATALRAAVQSVLHPQQEAGR